VRVQLGPAVRLRAEAVALVAEPVVGLVAANQGRPLPRRQPQTRAQARPVVVPALLKRLEEAEEVVAPEAGRQCQPAAEAISNVNGTVVFPYRQAPLTISRVETTPTTCRRVC
jgi:hypothetical protein